MSNENLKTRKSESDTPFIIQIFSHILILEMVIFNYHPEIDSSASLILG